MAASMTFASLTQLCVQQLWNSLRKRSTKREIAGSSRFIFDFAASYASAIESASLGGPSAKNGCCFSAVSEAWHSEQCCSSTGYTVVENSKPWSAGKFLLWPGSRSTGGSSSILRAAVEAVDPAQFVIHVVKMSPHAALLASQQLCPPPTFETIVESAGEISVTTPLAAE